MKSGGGPGAPIVGELAKPANDVLRSIANRAKGLRSVYQETTETLKSASNGPATQQVGRLLENATNITKDTKRQLLPAVQPAIEAYSANTKAARDAIGHVIVPGTDKVFVGNARIAKEQKNNPELYSKIPQSVKTLEAQVGDKANTEGGKMAFSVTDRPGSQTNQMQLIPTESFMKHLIADDSGWRRFSDGMKKMNPNANTKAVDEFYTGMRNDALNGEFSSVEKKLSQDGRRLLPNMPSGIIGLGGTPEYFFRDKPAEYYPAMLERTSNIVGYRKSFGLQPDLKTIRSELAKESPRGPSLFNDAVAAIHGRPTGLDNSEIGKILMSIGKPLHAVSTPAYLAALPLASFHVAGSIVYGNTMRAFGTIPMVKGLAYALKNPEGLRSMLATDTIATNLTFDPNSPVRSSLKIAANVLRYPVNFAHHLQAYGAAGAAAVVAERASSGSLGQYGKADFINTATGMFGLDRALATTLANGKGTQAQYDSYVQRAATVLSNRNTAPGERSKLENSRLFTTWTRAMSYPLSTIRNVDGLFRSMGEAWSSGNPAEGVSAAAKLLRSTTGLVATGIAAKMIAATLTGGFGGLKMAMQEDEDKRKNDVLGWSKSMLLSGLGGPISVLENMHHSSFGLGNVSYDVGLLGDAIASVSGSGKYKDMDVVERVEKFGSDRFRAGRVINTWLGVLGSGGASPDLDNAIQGLNHFKTDQQMVHITTSEAGSANSFRSEMRRIIENINAGEDPSDKILKILKLPDYHSVPDSLRARRLLFDGSQAFTPDQMTSLKNRIGPELVQKLVAYDDNLAAWALSYESMDRQAHRGQVESAAARNVKPSESQLQSNLAQAQQERLHKERQDENLRRSRAPVISAREALGVGGP